MTERLPFKQLSPVARPVDTYAAPMAPAVAKPGNEGSGLLELAKGLQAVSPELGKFLGSRQKRQDETAEARGKFLYAKAENKARFNEALDALKEQDPERYEQLAGSNPHLAAGWNRAWLEGKAMEYNDALAVAMAENPTMDINGQQVSVFDSNDPGVVNQYMGEHLQGFMAEHGLDQLDVVDVSDTFLPKAQGYQQSWVAQNASERRQQMVKGRMEQLGTSTNLTLRQGMQSELWQLNPDAAKQQLGQHLTTTIREAFEDGVRDRTALNAQVIDSVATLARETGNDDVLDVLDHIETSPGNVLGNTQAAKEVGQRTRDALWQRAIQEENIRIARQERAEKKFVEDIQSSAMEKLMRLREDPMTNVSEADIGPEIEALSEKGLTYQAEVLFQMQQRMISVEENVQNDKQTVHELTVGVDEMAVDYLDIDAAFATGQIDYSTRNRLASNLAQNKRYQEDDFLDIVRSSSRDVRSYITGTADGFSLDGDGEINSLAKSAELDFKNRFRSLVRAKEEEFDRKLRPHELAEMADEVATKVQNSPRYRARDASTMIPPIASPGNQRAADQSVQGGLDTATSVDEDTNTPLFQTQPLWSVEQLDAYVEEYNQTGGGPLPGLAAALKVSVEELYAAQARLVNPHINGGGSQ